MAGNSFEMAGELSADVAIVGGGLAGGLIALALAHLRPECRLLLIEAGEGAGGNHPASFFASDIADGDAWLLEPLVTAAWPQCEARFPRFLRVLRMPYRTIGGERLDSVLRQTLPAEAVLSGVAVTRVERERVTLADGRVVRAGGVIDARDSAGFPELSGGWQVFLRRTVRLTKPHALARPVVMDARVLQRDGFRVGRYLPLAPDTLLVEDTYYTDGSELEGGKLDERLRAQCAISGWQVAEVLGEETGKLPIIARGRFAELWPAGESAPALAGRRAGLFHPLTGNTVACAVKLALHVAELPDLSGEALARSTRAFAAEHWRRGGYYRMLARLMFGAALPKRRYKLLERFFSLERERIERFHAGTLSTRDKLRVLAGRPPVPVLRALSALLGGGFPLAPLGAPEPRPSVAAPIPAEPPLTTAAAGG
ncbi:MAG: lycopene beta-cyclase CrtY [Novosphingobium sp.]|nr:lycopene beta-cyclase CrtY [Novosphingobium sp.]